MNDKPTYHQYALGNFDYCGHAYYLDTIEGKKGLGNFFTCRGSGAHVARKVNLRQKVVTQEDLSLDVLQDAARDEVNRHFEEDRIDLKCDELAGKSKKSAAGLIIDTTLKIVEADRRLLQCRVKPFEVEVERKIVLASWPFDIQMRMDSVDYDNFITDMKTSIRRWSQQQADDQYQPSVYKLGYRVTFDRPFAGFRFHCVTCTKKLHKVSAYEIVTDRTNEQILAVLERFNLMHESIQKGNFAPAHLGSWKCSDKYCKFYRQCKYV